jgi:polyhydroxybutyrate depolymerase
MIRTVFVTGILGVAASLNTVMASSPSTMRIRVEGLQRTALVYSPDATSTSHAPIVFVFHGHGGSSAKAASSFGIHEQWPEAICVYMQGLPTATKNDPQGKEAGWQNDTAANGGRDLAFFDAVLARLKKQYAVDEKRIYAAGFSNGGGFTFLLWAQRGDVLAAVAVCGSQAGRKQHELQPKPCIHIAGRADNVVDFDRQQSTMNAVRKLNQCDETGQLWNKGTKAPATLYPSPSGTPFIEVIHPGGHEVPQTAGRMIARFLKENPRK